MTDDDIRAALHAADPARSLPPADAVALHPLLEDTMSQPQHDTGTTDLARRRRTRLALVAAAAAAAVVGVVGVVVAVNGDDPADGPGKDRGTEAGTVTELSAGPAVEAKCAAPTARAVATQTIAFEGKVISVADGLVTFEPVRFYQGTFTDRVTVDEPDLGMSEMPVDFQVGSTYIVGATDGQVSICGLSGLATDDRRALYEQAFPQ